MDRIKDSWFDKIDPPEKISTLKQSVDYLDRLIGGGPPQKQFIRQTNKHNDAKNNRQNKNSNIKHVAVKKSELINTDDTKWLEERKKRFPKFGQSASNVADEIVTDNNRKEDNSKKRSDKTDVGVPKSRGGKKRAHGIDNKQPPIRKKTLFEMLMDD